MQHRFRRFVLQLYRRAKHPKNLRNSPLRRWFATHFMDKSVWKPTRHTFAGGMAVGAFVMMLMVPGQMPLAMVAAALFRVNIPMAVIMSWIVNPFTAAPVAYAEIKLGGWIMTMLNMTAPPHLHMSEVKQLFAINVGLWDRLQPWAASLYVGGVISGLTLAFAFYAISFLLWDIFLMLAHRRKLPEG